MRKRYFLYYGKTKALLNLMRRAFQSPHGGIGASDNLRFEFSIASIEAFQSPCGGIGASD